MTSFSLALSAFRRHRLRTLFTVMSVATAFAIFTILAAIHQGLSGQVSYTTAQRLNTNEANNNSLLPLSYGTRIAAVPGVKAVAWNSGFNGYWQNPKNAVNVLAFSPDVLRVYPEFTISPAQERAFNADRAGVIVGSGLMEKMGWKIGDTIPLERGPLQKNGSTTWTFRIDGTYHTNLPSGFQQFFLIHYEYLNEGRSDLYKNTVAQIHELVDNPREVEHVGAAIDAQFAHSSPSTHTRTEQADTLSSLRRFGDISAMITYVAAAVFATMLLIAGHAMANSVRERIGEFAMMRALGFGRVRLVFLVLRESVLLIGAGSALGMAAGWELSRLLAPFVTPVLRGFGTDWTTFTAGVGIMLAFALLVGVLPSRRVASLPVAVTLRGA